MHSVCNGVPRDRVTYQQLWSSCSSGALTNATAIADYEIYAAILASLVLVFKNFMPLDLVYLSSLSIIRSTRTHMLSRTSCDARAAANAAASIDPALALRVLSKLWLTMAGVCIVTAKKW